ncbi:MAG: CotH kinase family protein [Bacteroidota bacterium]
MKILFLLCAAILSSYCLSQTFTASPNDTIYDNSPNDYPITVSGLGQPINTTVFGLEAVCITLEHSWVADLVISLIAPDGTYVNLISGVGGDSDYFTNTCLTSTAAESINSGASPYTGIFRPNGQMGVLNNGQDGNGIWILRVTDTYEQDAGNMFEFSLSFGFNPATIFTITESDLPIVMLETNGVEIPNEPKIGGNVSIIYHGEGVRNYTNQTDFHFAGNCGLEIRGASSSGFPKKSYDLEIRDNNGLDLDTALLGMPSESDWVLSAQYTDKTLLRNMLSMHLIQGMGWYAPRFKPVELFINGQYMGVYIFMEKVKKGNDRVDISTLNPNEISGDNLTGGYIVKLDKDSGNSNPGWESPFAPIPAGSSIVLDYSYPDGDVIAQQQMDYIRNYFTGFETALAGPDFMDPLAGYRNYVNYESCLDALLISEFTRSIDAYRKSFFIYKDKESLGGKLVMAPIWDYDLTYGNADFCDGQYPEGWQYDFNYVCGEDYWINPFWFPRMMEDTIFQADLRCRWNTLRESTLHPDTVKLWIDQMAQKINESQEWNYTIWQTMGTYVWPNSFVGANYAEETNFLKDWIDQRFTWLDANIPGNILYCTPAAGTADLEPGNLKIYPNPASDFVYLELEGIENPHIRLTDISGNLVTDRFTLENGKAKIRLEGLAKGIYLIEIQFNAKQITQKVTIR